MPFDKNEISTSCWGRRGAGKIAGACIRDKSGNERVHRRGNRKRSSGGEEKEGERDKERERFLSSRIRRGCTSGCWPGSRRFRGSPIPSPAPFISRVIIIIRILRRGGCGYLVRQTLVSAVAVAAPETALDNRSLPFQRNIFNILSPCIRPSMILDLGIG